MPQTCQPGDTVLIRAQVREAGADYLQVLIQDRAALMSSTLWVAISECARPENAADLTPIRITRYFFDRG